MSVATIETPDTLMTDDDFWALPTSLRPMELVRGKVVFSNVAGPRHEQLCARSVRIFGSFIEEHDLGHVLSNDSGIITDRDPDTVRGMSVCYYSYSRLPIGPLPARHTDVVPELIVEVRSPSDRWSRILTKVGEYLEVGVSVVFVLDPETETARIYLLDTPECVVHANEELTFPNILPGFAVPVRRFFE